MTQIELNSPLVFEGNGALDSHSPSPFNRISDSLKPSGVDCSNASHLRVHQTFLTQPEYQGCHLLVGRGSRLVNGLPAGFQEPPLGTVGSPSALSPRAAQQLPGTSHF